MPQLAQISCWARTAWLLAAACLYFASGVEVANAQTVSGTISYWDARKWRSNATGSRLTTGTSLTDRGFDAGVVWLYDEDGACNDFKITCSESDDDYLGWSYVDDDGFFSFPNVSGLQDVYIRYTYRNAAGVVLDQNANEIQAVSRTIIDVASNTTLDFSASCPSELDGECDNQATANNTWANAGFAMLAASMSEVHKYTGLPLGDFGADAGIIVGMWPNGPATECNGLAGASWDDDKFCVSFGNADDPHVIGHEMGHLYHARAFGFSSTTSLLNGLTTCTALWADANTSEKCVTVEGYASFLSTATWWANSADHPLYRSWPVEDLTTFNNASPERCIGWDGTIRERFAGNVTRYFWDLYDTHNNDPNASGTAFDNETHAIGDIHWIWSLFPAGTGNHQASESGADGRNVYDYEAYDNWLNADLVAERRLSCLTNMQQ